MRTPARAYRFADAAVADQQQLADALDTSRTDAINLAVLSLRERLGLVRRDAVAVVEAIVREDGDDAPVVVTITNAARGEASVEIAGTSRLDFTGWLIAAYGDDGVGLGAGALYAREETTGTHFAFGTVDEPIDGASLTVRAADLPDLVMLRGEGDSAARLRQDFKTRFALRRSLRDALGSAE